MSSALLIDSSSSEASKAIASAGGPRFPEEPTEPTDFEKPTDISEEPTDFGSAEFLEEVTGPKDPLMEFASLLDMDYVLWFLRFHAKELDSQTKSGFMALHALLREVEAADEARDYMGAMQDRADVAILDVRRSVSDLMDTAGCSPRRYRGFSPSKRHRPA